jgi:hypothetical protein
MGLQYTVRMLLYDYHYSVTTVLRNTSHDALATLCSTPKPRQSLFGDELLCSPSAKLFSDRAATSPWRQPSGAKTHHPGVPARNRHAPPVAAVDFTGESSVAFWTLAKFTSCVFAHPQEVADYFTMQQSRTRDNDQQRSLQIYLTS